MFFGLRRIQVKFLEPYTFSPAEAIPNLGTYFRRP
jgi:hypothetical protein